MLTGPATSGHDLASVDADVPSEPSHAPYAPTTVVHAMHAGVVGGDVRVLRVESLDTEWDTSARMLFLGVARNPRRGRLDRDVRRRRRPRRRQVRRARYAIEYADEYDAELDRRKNAALPGAIARGEQIIDETTSGDPVRAARAWGRSSWLCLARRSATRSPPVNVLRRWRWTGRR